MPRALTEQEKCRQCQKLLDKGRAVLMSQGLKRISVDDIVNAAGMAKGTFYQHFDSKEKYLFVLIEDIHKQVFAKSEQMILSIFKSKSDADNLKANAREFFKKLFYMPEMAFFIQNEREIDELFFGLMGEDEVTTFKQIEVALFKKLLRLVGVDTVSIKPGVVHNYIHSLYLTMSSDLMTAADLPETVDLLTDGLIAYIFGGAI